ncbi:hypothetical protein BJ878DRAFT_547289 [Calycina marina]|uniref:Uncharacterized protein n=1 Tax=Calycina marina TaxID=1763456 RepID=A0A9P8CJC0_9HELO|nr:hypothetical protein BJ878DRAFT_547289 [Calycina marina]
MGRKPNALILTHFERGAKLNDSSNRYEHTCKSCGEIFPKGRIDSLTNHLIKKCPSLSLRDRHKALLTLHSLPEDGMYGQNGEVQMNGPTVELPVGQRNWTALETLAEVSRQIDMSEKQPGDSTDGRATEHPRAVRLELREQYTLENPPLSYEQQSQRDKKRKPIQPERGNPMLIFVVGNDKSSQQRASPLAITNGNHPQNASRSASPNLAIAASSIAAAAAAARFVPSMVDPLLLADESHQDNHEMQQDAQMNQDMKLLHSAMFDSGFNANPHEHQDWEMIGQDGNIFQEQHIEQTMVPDNHSDEQTPRRQADVPMTTEFSTEFGDGQKAIKPKSRAKFQAPRRKEVQAVRKIGACIRCRVLRKTCSLGTPCDQCKKVESARVWKHPCSRTKIADEFLMYSASLHVVLASSQIILTKSETEMKAIDVSRGTRYSIEASHYPETTIYADFGALYGQTFPREPTIDPGLRSDFNTSTLRILDSDGDDLASKLEAYVKRMSHVFIQREPSHFMSVTLNRAAAATLSTPDSLLARVLELWSIVHILVDHELKWILTEKSDHSTPPGQGQLIDQNDGDNTYAVMCLQLSAAAEKKAAVMCKHLLSDLERQMCDRPKKGSPTHFELYIITMILLNCVEKTTWLFRCWGQESFRTRWPLENPPSFYANQGDQVVDHFHYLMRMRNILPKINVDSEGILTADVVNDDESAMGFFRALHLNHNEIVSKKDHPVFDQSNSRCFELRYCSTLLLPTLS